MKLRWTLVGTAQGAPLPTLQPICIPMDTESFVAACLRANLIVRPNPGANFSAASYEAKTARRKLRWPEITVLAADFGGNTVRGGR